MTAARATAGSPPAILLGGEMIALSVARSLAPHGIPVYGLGHRDDPLRVSRHRTQFVDVGMGSGLGERFMDWLRAGPREGVVIPCADEALDLVARKRSELSELGYLTIEANDEAMLAMLDKEATYTIARQAGIEAPRTAIVTSVDGAREAAARIGYPCALKPRHGHAFRHRFAGTKAFVVTTDGELEQAVGEAEDLAMIVTEIIPGAEAGFCSYYSYLDSDGRPLFELTKRKLRQFPPGFGLGTYHLTDWNPEVAELGLRFFQAAGIRGLANVEFKRDRRDGRLKLIECNHRLTAANEQLRLSGADLALLIYSRIVGSPDPPAIAYRRGVGHWSPLADLRAFLIYRQQGELSTTEWIRSLIRPQTFPVASISDPVPGLAAAARRVRRRFERVARHKGRSIAEGPMRRG